MTRESPSPGRVPPNLTFALSVLAASLATGISPARAVGAADADATTSRRIAVIVGANAAPPGRRALRFAHDDARQMAEVLQRVGRFRADDVYLLLDPTPKELATRLAAVGQTVRTTARNAIFVFYYSGHSDGQDLFPRGDSLSLSELRTRIDSIGARLSLGILDTCRGGSWTQAKGLTVGPPLADTADLESVDLMALASEGTALISSSSGLENAHEGRAINGSFFTHHLTGALLGAGDRDADGRVTLQEAFDYAKALTIRDSARMAETTQHPSFDVQIRGRSDVVLAQIPSDTSTLVVTSESGPLEVIHLASGITVLEMSAGMRKVRLALAPGRYLVRKHGAGQIATKEVDVVAGRTAFLAEQELEVGADPRLAVLSKGQGDQRALEPRQLVSLHTTVPRKTWDLRYALGSSTGPNETWRDTFFIEPRSADVDKSLSRRVSSSFSLTYGITDRLMWAAPLPAFAYRFGEPSGLEVVPHGGLFSLAYGTHSGLMGTVGAGVDFRLHPAAGQSLSVLTSATSDFASSGAINYQPTGAPTVWRLQGGLAYALTLRDTVTLGFGVHVATPLRLGRAAAPGDPQMETTLLLGALPSVGFRPLPLISVHLSDAFSLDGYASWAVRPKTGAVVDRYLLGFTWNF